MYEQMNRAKQLRISRINQIESIIKQATREGKPIDYKKLIAEFCLREGISKRTIKEYLSLLIDSSRIKNSKGNLTYNFQTELEITEKEADEELNKILGGVR